VEQLAYSLAELADAARVGESSLRKMIREGRGPDVTSIGRRRIVLASDAWAWLESLKQKVAA
jgi:hypothetical protein